eukprot:TRINITY_DN8150_c1_g1_i4.p2 TRINITY_DN8150_c1_g1~~TRINITY_DN8150_c1_g1_i4.p2  ORF type:complete len:113 (-),score=0.40 TRINITY_DN8150_c1_g1_i4:63-401(-)
MLLQKLITRSHFEQQPQTRYKFSKSFNQVIYFLNTQQRIPHITSTSEPTICFQFQNQKRGGKDANPILTFPRIRFENNGHNSIHQTISNSKINDITSISLFQWLVVQLLAIK